MTIRIPTPENSFLEFDVDVVNEDIPLLVGLDISDRHGLIADKVEKMLHSR